jgi:hypothetical protein
MKRIIVSIDPQGQLSIEAEGYQGNGCLQATQMLERMLGRVEKRSRKSECFHSAHSGAKQKLEQRVGEGA